MKIKRFFAPDIRKAMKMVKEELGADAVIMSNRSVDGGVEIVAARDFDEQVIHNKLNQQNDENNESSALKDIGFSERKKPLHVISSPRKRRADGTTTTQNPVRRNLDQYLGYAEKIHRASIQQQQKTAGHSTVSDSSRKSKVGPSSVQPDNKAVPSQPHSRPVSPAFAIDKLIQGVRNEIREEMNELKMLMDNRLSEVARHNGQERQPVRMNLLRHLADMGFSKTLSTKIANRLDSHHNADLAFEKAQEMLAKILPVAEENLLEQGGIVTLVGPTGVGKTTTIAKIAAQFILKHGSRQVALITTDNYRIGAHEQIQTYGRILDIPVKVANDAAALRQHIDSFMDRKLILIDTAGMSQRDMRLAEQIKTLQPDDLAIETYLVISATTQYQALLEIMEAFKIFSPQAGILTKLDETVTQGATLSAIIEQQLPLSFLTDGQQVPEDIHEPDSTALIKQCVSGLKPEPENDYTHDLSYDQWVAEGYA